MGCCKAVRLEFLRTELNKRRVPAYWTYTYLLSTLYGKEEAKLTFWKDVKITKALYPELEIILTGEKAFIEFRSAQKPCITLNGKALESSRSGYDLWRIFPTENGTLKMN